MGVAGLSGGVAMLTCETIAGLWACTSSWMWDRCIAATKSST